MSLPTLGAIKYTCKYESKPNSHQVHKGPGSVIGFILCNLVGSDNSNPHSRNVPRPCAYFVVFFLSCTPILFFC